MGWLDDWLRDLEYVISMQERGAQMKRMDPAVKNAADKLVLENELREARMRLQGEVQSHEALRKEHSNLKSALESKSLELASALAELRTLDRKHTEALEAFLEDRKTLYQDNCRMDSQIRAALALIATLVPATSKP